MLGSEMSKLIQNQSLIKTESVVQIYAPTSVDKNIRSIGLPVKKVSTKLCNTKKTDGDLQSDNIEFEKIKQTTTKHDDDKCDGDNISFKTMKDFETLSQSSELMKPIKEKKKKVAITRSEKKWLEDIKRLAVNTKIPTDERQMVYYNKENNKVTGKIELVEAEMPSNKELTDAAALVKESPSKVITPDIETLAKYLRDLQTIIATREISWATATESEYAFRAEITKLKTEANHLRILGTKRQNEIKERNREIAELKNQLGKHKEEISKLRSAVIKLEKEKMLFETVDDPYTQNVRVRETLIGKEAIARAKKRTRLQMLEEIFLSKTTHSNSLPSSPGKSSNQPTMGKNLGPAALIANALYRARTAGSLVNF